MLEKIVQIKTIGRFRDYAANGDVTFRKLTLVYAENGRGKTTFCAILRSLQTGQPEFIAERKTLAVTVPAFVHLRLNNDNYQFSNGAWTATYPDVLIFDPMFVNENVYSGDYVEHEHKKNSYRVIVGAQGVQLAKQIEDLDGQIRDANTDLRTKKDAVSRHLTSGTALDDYLQWQPVADIEEQIRRKTEELSNRQRAAAKSGEIQARGLFAKVQIPSLPPDFAAVLAKQLTDIVADAETKVRQQIAQHQMGPQGEPWLSQGLSYVKDDRCPFCGQGLRASDLIGAYRSHFNAAYGSLKQEVAQLSQRVNSAIGEISLFSAQQAIRARESAALATSVHLICRPRPDDAPVGDWADVLRELPNRVGDWMERLQSEGVRGADLVFACIGPALEIFSRYTKVETADGREVALAEYLEKVWEVVGRSALAQVLGTAEAKARNGAAGAVEEDARLTALFLWTLQSTDGETAENANDEADDEEPTDEDDDEEGFSREKAKGFTLVFDVVRRFAQPLGIDLPKWEGRVIQTKKGVVRLLPIAERATELFGEDGAQAVATRLEQQVALGTNPLQGMLFPDLEAAPKVRGWGRGRGTLGDIEVSDESLAAAREATTLDRVHAAMLLQAGGRTNALRALLKAEQERGPDFLRLANAFSALYPKGSEEKRLIDAMLLAVPR